MNVTTIRNTIAAIIHTRVTAFTEVGSGTRYAGLSRLCVRSFARSRIRHAVQYICMFMPPESKARRSHS